MDTFIGFDYAWTDNPKNPGAVAAVCMDGKQVAASHAPRLVTFDRALSFIDEVRSPDGMTLVAIDQPTIVPNNAGIRLVERVAASLISWMGGGVQPSNRGRTGMFCAKSPVWHFLASLDAIEDPEMAYKATTGLFIVEVFPALALASLQAAFCDRLCAPRYNPARRQTFKLMNWIRVAETAAERAEEFTLIDVALWCRDAALLSRPNKADQDKLDAVLCMLVAFGWRYQPREKSIMLGDLTSGCMVSPGSSSVRLRLAEAARRYNVPIT